MNNNNLNTLGIDAGGYYVYENMFGKGGDGGAGALTSGGGGGGYGGGNGGRGDSGGSGVANGGNGGNSYTNALGGTGGVSNGLGSSGADNWHGSGGGGGGNSGNGGESHSGHWGGGGGGGYGGGILTVLSDTLSYDTNNPPKLLVSGQQGGTRGYDGGFSHNGNKGEGGLIIIESPDYLFSSQHWNLDSATYGQHLLPSTNGGHGTVTGNPQKIFVNGAEYIDVAGVTLDQEAITLNTKPESYTLAAAVSPADAMNKNIRWQSSNPNIATVDGNGTVTAISPGNAVITVTTVDGGYTDSCNVTVVPQVQSVSLDQHEIRLFSTDEAGVTLTANILPVDATNHNVTWTSSNILVATVDPNGLIRPGQPGTATITVKTQDGERTDTCQVIVGLHADGVTIDKNNLTLTAGASTAALTATVSPNEALNKKVIWSSANQSVAIVSANGIVTPLGPGLTEITATTEDGGFRSVCTVEVLPSLISAMSPDREAVGVSVNEKIRVTFTKDLDLRTLNGSTMYLAGGGDLIPADIAYHAATRIAELTPLEALQYNTVYTMYLNYQIKSTDGTLLGQSNGCMNWSFTTEKETLPGPANVPWAQYMCDPGHSGQSPGVITNSSGLCWKVFTGSGDVAPAVGDSLIYTASNSGLKVLNIDGTVNWSYSQSPVSTPAVAGDGNIYFISSDSSFYTVKDGTLQNSTELAKNSWTLAPLLDQSGNKYAVAVVETDYFGKFYTSYLTKIGSWTKSFDQIISTPPAADSNGMIYLGAGSTVYAYTTNGQVAWTKGVADGSDIISLALDKSNNIYLTTRNGSLEVLSSAGQLLWTKSFGVALTPVCLSEDGKIFVGSSDGSITILSPEGTNILQINTGSPIVAPPVIDTANNIVVGTISGWVFSYRYDGTERWRFKTAGQVVAPPAIGGNGTVYVVSTDGYLYALGGSTVELIPALKKVPVGAEVYCMVKASGLTDLYGADMTISFDSSVLEVNSLSLNYFFNNAVSPLTPEEGWITDNCFAYNNTLGKIKISGSKKGNDSFSGNIDLATINFKTKAKGITQVLFTEITLVDKYAQDISLTKKNTAIEVTVGSILTGIISPEGKAAYTDIVVTLEDTDNNFISSIKPLADWCFIFTDLAADTYNISVCAPVFLRERIDNITIAEDNETKDIGVICLRTGDINKDNVVDLMDLVLFANTYYTVPGDERWLAEADFNKDNRINIIDLAYMARNYDYAGKPAPNH